MNSKSKGGTAITGYFHCKRTPERVADYLDGHNDYSLAEIALRPGQIFTRNSQIQALPYSIVDGQNRFWIEYDEARNAEISVIIPPKFPQKEEIISYPKVEALISIEPSKHERRNPLVTFVFADCMNHVALHLSTRDCIAANMTMTELAQLSRRNAGTPYRYLAAYEDRPLPDMLKELVLTERYFFVGILIPSKK